MKTNIFVPSKINVGFQNRQDTYTGKLAYVIYFDEKGKLRKETSWQNWRSQDIPNEIYDNEPTEGFVLNKKVGGNNYSWNPRQTYTRVYDPRGFEFEITIPNLLWILENCNCIKGKGLEGQFVYGWDGKELVLVPVDSPDYKEIQEKNKVIHNNEFIKAKDLIVGATYGMLNGEKYVYMGKYDVYEQSVVYRKCINPWSIYSSGRKYEWECDINDGWIDDNVGGTADSRCKNVYKGKQFWFIRLGNNESNYCWERDRACYFKSVTRKFADVITVECDKYPEYYSMLEHDQRFSPIDYSKNKILPVAFEDFKRMLIERMDSLRGFHNYYVENGRLVSKYIYMYYDKTKQKYYYELTYSNDKLYFDANNIEEVYRKLNPMYGEQYLENGNLCLRRGYYGTEE